MDDLGVPPWIGNLQIRIMIGWWYDDDSVNWMVISWCYCDSTAFMVIVVHHDGDIMEIIMCGQRVYFEWLICHAIEMEQKLVTSNNICWVAIVCHAIMEKLGTVVIDIILIVHGNVGIVLKNIRHWDDHEIVVLRLGLYPISVCVVDRFPYHGLS